VEASCRKAIAAPTSALAMRVRFLAPASLNWNGPRTQGVLLETVASPRTPRVGRLLNALTNQPVVQCNEHVSNLHHNGLELDTISLTAHDCVYSAQGTTVGGPAAQVDPARMFCVGPNGDAPAGQGAPNRKRYE
jgi:hypothetical protein